MTDKEKIRAEIERRMNCYDKSGIDIEKYFAVEDEELLEFIDSMQEEPVSEDLWESSKHYALLQVLASTDAEMAEQAY